MAKKLSIEEKLSQPSEQQINLNNILSKTIMVYCKKSAHLLFLAIAFAKMKPRLFKKRESIINYAVRAHQRA